MASRELLRREIDEIISDFNQRVVDLSSQAEERLDELLESGRPSLGWAIGAAAAFGLGYLIGLVSAPRSGEEIRSDLAARAQSLSSSLRDRFGTAA